MKVIVDRVRCEGHGLCEEAAPQMFQLDDEGELMVLQDAEPVPAEQIEAVADAARTCPVGALRVES
ncbi:ferredoxin [Actinomadura atramentaria]|uniref:ferredoxin n=1 Tax=Actinomadura atramentaria TaxID=1990 RepID=UPI00036C8CBF|nr:ferredoxin [Actinomadura atramentaria]